MHMLDSTQSAIKIYDINLRRPLPDWDVVQSSLEKTHVLKCNEVELRWLAEQLKIDSTETESIAAAIIERFDLRYVFWTRGEDGCVLQDRQQLTSSPLKIDLANYATLDEDADTIGAGDATSAALAIGLLQAWEAERIVRAANVCGAYAANSRGATSPLPDRVKSLIFDWED
jgi:fructokinase